MTDSLTTAETSKPKATWKYKRVLVPKGKPVPKNEGDYTTPRGQDITIVPDGVFGLYVAKWVGGGGGILPPELRSKFTSDREARYAIEKYLRRKR